MDISTQAGKQAEESYQQYLLVCLMEECAEVAHMASKIYRFGQHDTEPGKSSYNCQRLSAEIGDLYGVIEMLKRAGINIDDPIVDSARKHKADKIIKYLNRPRKP